MSEAIESRPRRRISRPPPGSPPGLLTVDPTLPAPELRLTAYGPDAAVTQKIDDAGRVHDFLGKYPVTWIDVDGVGDPGTIETLGSAIGMHRLSMEDVLHVYQRPKLEDYGSYLFVILRMPHCCPEDFPQGGAGLVTEQIALVLGKNYVMTFQEREHPGDVWGPIRDRIAAKTRIVSDGPDHLAYALLDAVIDSYFPVLEQLGDALDSLEERVMGRPDQDVMEELHAVKRDLVAIRRATWPLRELVGAMLRDETPLIAPGTRVYLRDCYDHTVQIIDLVESYRDLGSGLMDVYLSNVSNRLNEIMKVLTIIATIFIPLTFISSIYGMNFDTSASPFNMPELHWRYGYPAALALMALVTVGMLVYFRRKGWLGGKPRS